MKLVEGTLSRLGESTVNMKNEYVKYSLIQIGNEIITNVVVDRKLNNFLNDGLNTTAPTRLWFLGKKTIMAVQIGNGMRFYGKVNPFFYGATALYFGLTYAAFNIHWGVRLADDFPDVVAFPAAARGLPSD